MKTLLIFSMTMALSTSAFAADARPFCFKDKESYERVKERLPRPLQELPLHLVTTSRPLSGGVKAYFVDDQVMKMEGAFGFGLAVTSTSSYIDKVCVQNGVVEITTGDSTQTLRVLENGDVVIQNFTLVQASAGKYAEVVEGLTKVRNKIPDTAGSNFQR